ncbi:MAG: ornithine cyclodeaminase family protein [Bacteroidetes bacterium]|jgi:alanine dehydrogenase|nr:ornithine cyclodeaminase family protein [Bacteroidota bacterium]MBT6685803.1 ornithine cyclodeaminase family protein [Bacteroidota bacterium]MBT7143715.1 ornithine cyclodeaminase family protein [Bacteroidota bacterium]MBT7491942.1 ornithine cyclodeaminase family protein [Bacteroidota bacterium]
MVLILNRQDVISVLDMKDCIDVVEKAFIELANGTAVLPLRTNIKPAGGLSLYMPAYLKDLGALACKIVTVYKDNPKKFNIPTTIGKVLLQNPETGDVNCIMDGGYLTAVRTGAVSGVATKYLARTDSNQKVGIYGTGVQAKMQLWAVSLVRDISNVLVYDLSKESAAQFVNEMSEKLNLKISIAGNPDELLDTDIICAATSSATPLFDGAKLKEGTHINGIGSHTPNARELDTETILRSKFVGDSKEACFNEAGDIIIPLNEGLIKESHFYAELGEILIGKKEARTSNKEITVFKSNGLAIQDVATAKLIYDKALKAGIGANIEI